jgi:hypothetical protein
LSRFAFIIGDRPAKIKIDSPEPENVEIDATEIESPETDAIETESPRFAVRVPPVPPGFPRLSFPGLSG